MPPALKNWTPRQVKKFLLNQGFEEVKKKSRGRGDHVCLAKGVKGNTDYKYTEIDMGRKSGFSALEMAAFAKQTGIPKEEWKK